MQRTAVNESPVTAGLNAGPRAWRQRIIRKAAI
jgi:hypothetical protein